MARRFLVTTILLAFAAAASAAEHYAVLISEGNLPESGEYYSQWHIMISLDPGEDWVGAELTADIDPGDGLFYQHPFNDPDPPMPMFFPVFPDSEYTSYYTSPGEWPNTEYQGDIVQIGLKDDTPPQLWAAWFDQVYVPGPGDFVIAQITVLPWDPYEWSVEVSVMSQVDPSGWVSDTLWLGGGGGDDFYAAPESIDFGDVAVGHTSAPQTVTVTHHTGEYLEVDTHFSGPAQDDFYCTPWWASIPSGQSEDFDVTFSPSAPGTREATLTFEGWYWVDDPNWPEWVLWGTIDVELSGVGIATSLDVDPEAVDFGNVFIGQTSDPATITLSNNCGMDVEVDGLTLSGANAADFDISSAPPLPFIIPDGQSEAIDLTFIPSAWAAREAMLTIESPDLTEGIDVPLSGYGVCLGDLDDDGDVDLSDLAQLLANYGSSGMTYEDGDLDGDGDVDLADLAGLLAVYGTSC